MKKLLKSEEFDKWLKKLKDKEAKGLILARLKLLELNNHRGSYRHIEKNIFELKINSGPGYRVYYVELSNGNILLLGGTKRTQKRDIEKVKKMLNEIDIKDFENKIQKGLI